MLHKRDEYNHKSETTSCNIQERCSNSITETTLNLPQNTPILSHNNTKPSPELFVVDWLSRQKHKENKDEEIDGMSNKY